MRVFDPQEPFLRRCNKIFLVLCAVSLSVDPMFFYLPEIDAYRKCLLFDTQLEVVATTLRFTIDAICITRVIFQFRTGFYPRPYVIVSRSHLVIDSWMIARRYLKSYFVIDILAMLPLPQVALLLAVPKMGGSQIFKKINLLVFVILFQFVPRFLRFYKLFQETVKSSNGNSGIVRNRVTVALLFYIWAAHVVGGFWYLFGIKRELECWKIACESNAEYICNVFYCKKHTAQETYFNTPSLLETRCPSELQGRSPFDFGMYIDAHNSGILHKRTFWQKFVYCFWWALQNLSTLGQNLKTSTSVLEICFAVAIFISGLVLFSFVIGIIQQTMLSMLSSRITAEKMMMKLSQDIEHWMDTRHLPEDLRERIRQCQHQKLERNQALEVDNLLNDLPCNLRKDITRHLCLPSIKKVPIFDHMNPELLDAMCERLKQTLYTEKINIIREGDPVHELLFIARGNLLTTSTDNETPGFSYQYLMTGDYCGEELQTWILDPKLPSNLPISRRTVRTLTEVEAFSLKVDDFTFITSQLMLILNQQAGSINFRFYSQQWRTWAACFIQAAWRRYRRRKVEGELLQAEDRLRDALAGTSDSSPSLGATIYASRFASNALRSVRLNAVRKARVIERVQSMLLQKPLEPDSTIT